MQGRHISKKLHLFLLITVIAVVMSYTLIQYNRYRENLFIYKEFTNTLIDGYCTFFRADPDSINDFIEFAEVPDFDWNQYTQPYQTFDSIIMLKLLKKSTLIIENDTLYIYLMSYKNKNKCCIKPENYSLLNYFWTNNDILINAFSLHHRIVGNRGMYNLELFKDYNRLNDTIVKFHFSKKLREFHRYHFNTNILPTFNLDSTTLFFHVKKVNDGFAWKVIYNPMNFSANKADSIFQLIEVGYLNDSLTKYFDRINIPVIVTKKE